MFPDLSPEQFGRWYRIYTADPEFASCVLAVINSQLSPPLSPEEAMAAILDPDAIAPGLDDIGLPWHPVYGRTEQAARWVLAGRGENHALRDL